MTEMLESDGGIGRKLDFIVQELNREANTIGSKAQDAQIALGDSFDPMQGVSAQDYAGRDITERVSVSGSVDTSVAGTYTLTYTVSDEAGNSAAAVRVITVVSDEKEPEQPSGETDTDDPTHRPDQGNTGVSTAQGAWFGAGLFSLAALFVLMRKRITTLFHK